MREKFKSHMKKRGGGGWTEIPNCLLTGEDWKGLKSRHRYLLIALLARDYHGGKFKLGMAALQKATGLGNHTIIAATSELEELGLLRVTRGPRNERKPNEYDLTPFYEQFIEPPAPTPEEPAATRRERPADLRALIEREREKSV